MAADGNNRGVKVFGASMLASRSPIRALLHQTDQVGAVFRLNGFHEALVITNDAFIRDAFGVPLHAFLLAAVPALADPKRAGSGDADDDELLLLRVTGTIPLPEESDMQRLRARVGIDLVTEDGRQEPRPRDQFIDPLTEVEMQTSGLRCAILGTFYDREVGGENRLTFGSDLDNIYAASRLRVYKPYGSSLQRIVSYLQDVAEGQPGIVQLGNVRYASTQRRERLAKQADKPVDVPVLVNVEDFVAHKTAVFGMTRLGKSNTMKVIATAVFQYAKESGRRVGQLIFDPAAEYAEENEQDQTALAQIGAEYVRRYRFGASQAELKADPGLRPLALNFFNDDDNAIATTWELVRDAVSDRAHAQYVTAFMSANPVGPTNPQTEEDYRQRQHALRARLMLYAALMKAGLAPPADWGFWAPLSKQLREDLKGRRSPTGQSLRFLDQAMVNRGGFVRLDARQVRVVAETIAEATAAQDVSETIVEWYRTDDASVEKIANVLMDRVGGGHKILIPLSEGYHSPVAEDDYAPQIYKDLVAGQIVIVDLSRGNEGVLQFASERIVHHILQQAGEKFRSGRPLDTIQIFLEEAHRLLDRDRFKNARTADPYVRLAKEAAKFKIGMVYATQEVSTVEGRILSNTANWLVAHLNNEDEVKHLRGRYEFDRFAQQILTAEDPGFIRLKTRSSRYLIPVHVREFSQEMVLAARDAAKQSEADGNGGAVQGDGGLF